MVCSVMFNFLGRDFFTALSNKDVDKFTEMLIRWLCALCAGIPVFVFRDYYQACAGVAKCACKPSQWVCWTKALHTLALMTLL